MKSLALFTVFLSLAASAEPWDKDNNPRNFEENFQYKLEALPLKASLPSDKTPWSNSYWPRKKGGINYRWNTANPIGYKLRSPSRMSVQSMSIEELAKLSPAEKFDLAQGRYNYPFSALVEKGSKKSAEDYEGLCDGWTASAIQFTEPAAVEIKNPDGIVIPFGSSDVKALMSYDVSINGADDSLGPVFVGGYCSMPFGMKLGNANCKDINPGAFHVILANQIGLMKEAFAVDIDPGKETWNQPVYGYEFEIVGRTTAKGAASAYIVHAKMMYAEDAPLENPEKVFSWEPSVGTDKYASGIREYDYILELDYSGRIIGGSWLDDSKRQHPDLFWKPTKKIKWTPDFEFLNTIYKPATLNQ